MLFLVYLIICINNIYIFIVKYSSFKVYKKEYIYMMLQKIFIFLFLFFLSGCSIDSLMVWGEVDKVHIVKQTSYVKHYRAYFQRSPLHTIRHGKKYLYFYNSKNKDLAIVLHPQNKYILYSFSHPNIVIRIHSDRRHGYHHMIKVLKHKGYRVASPTAVGYTAHVSLRRYKKIKTLLVDVRNYRHLQSLYRKAIKSYNAKSIQPIKTKLPKVLIKPYYEKYKAQATTPAQLEQLKIIAAKLHLNAPVSKEETALQEETQTIIDTLDSEEEAERLYHYYLSDASYYELNNYLSTSEARSTLSYNQYNTLEKRSRQLYEKKLLESGSLEELITAYKKNKNPQYKAKIMSRIKEIQQKK